jgi:hypothetical protein
MGAHPLVGQEVRFRRGTGGQPRADQLLLRTLARDTFIVIAHDTVLGPDVRISSDVLVLNATLRLEGEIEGNLVGVQSDIFARPGSRVGGSIVTMAGGFYGSTLARVTTPSVNAAPYDYRVDVQDDSTFVISGPGRRSRLRLVGQYGFDLPNYDRVDALTLRWGADYQPGARPLVPYGRGRLLFHTARGDVGGWLELRWPFGRHALVLRGGRVARSNDEWTQGDIENSITSLLVAMDTRSYYDARYAEAALRLEYGERRIWSFDLRSGWEQARSLANEDPFSIFSVLGGFQPNTPVIDADIVSATVGAGFELFAGGLSLLQLEGSLEGADSDLASDLSFLLWSGRLLGQLSGAGGSLRLEARGQLAGGSGAPPQRWGALGGWGSLPTLRPLERQGDHLWWVQAEYRRGLTARIDYVGRLTGWLRYAVGNAWIDGEPRPSVVHNIGVGVAMSLLQLGVFTAPSDDFDTVLVVGFGGP